MRMEFNAASASCARQNFPLPEKALLVCPLRMHEQIRSLLADAHNSLAAGSPHTALSVRLDCALPSRNPACELLQEAGASLKLWPWSRDMMQPLLSYVLHTAGCVRGQPSGSAVRCIPSPAARTGACWDCRRTGRQQRSGSSQHH